MFETISPIDGSVFYKGEKHSLKDIKNALELANKAQKDWAALTIKQRATFHKSMG